MAIIIPTGLAVKSVTGAYVLPVIIGYTIKLFAELLIIYGLLELVCWVFHGRPPISEYLRTSFLSRHICAVLIEGSEENDEDRRPAKPLNSVWGFFTSRSPLDDLFVTFECTRILVDPNFLREISDAEDGSIKA
jgi:hypothetical protein